MHDDCEDCPRCDGEGTAEVEKECQCCYGSGYHELETDCGGLTHAPCERCDWSGFVEVEADCPDCNGTGDDHTYVVTGKQDTFSDGTVTVEVCSTCGDKRFVE